MSDMLVLSGKRIEEIYFSCRFRPDELVFDDAIGEGIMSTAIFHRGRLDACRQEIRDMLAELPDDFRESGGGGWSFVNACLDRNGNQWTDSHTTMDHLLSLGLATKQVDYNLPRAMWHLFPGSIPYITINM